MSQHTNHNLGLLNIRPNLSLELLSLIKIRTTMDVKYEHIKLKDRFLLFEDSKYYRRPRSEKEIKSSEQ